MLRVLSLGAGVQSTTLALMAAHGEIDMPDVAIFADTHWEPQVVYDHLAWLRSANVLPFPINIVSRGDIREGIRDRRKPAAGRVAAIPWHIVNPDGSTGLGRRQCSSEYKLTPIMHEIRRLLGKPGRAKIAKGVVEVLIGISWDERDRINPARQQYMVNRYPLLEKQMRRHDCLLWLERHDYPKPPKSSCIGCPFHNNDYWRELRDKHPGEFAEAVKYDALLRTGNARGMRGAEFMHDSHKPLAEADLSKPPQGDLFRNDCGNTCGVWL